MIPNDAVMCKVVRHFFFTYIETCSVIKAILRNPGVSKDSSAFLITYMPKVRLLKYT